MCPPDSRTPLPTVPLGACPFATLRLCLHDEHTCGIGTRSGCASVWLLLPGIPPGPVDTCAEVMNRAGLPGRATLLTDREVEVLKALYRAGSTKGAAPLLGVTEGTVKEHSRRIPSGLAVSGRMAAMCWACRRGILDEWQSDSPSG